MNYSIKLYWNGACVLDGMATAVVAYEMARAHIDGNFAGPLHRQYVEGLEGVQTLMERGKLDWHHYDKSGKARAIVARV